MHKNIKISISIVFFIQINTCTHLYINANQILMCVDFFTRNLNFGWIRFCSTLTVWPIVQYTCYDPVALCLCIEL